MNQTSMALAGAQREKKIVETIQSYGKRLYGFIRGRVRSDEDADDILQEVWLQLSRMVDVEAIEQMSGWLFTVARNRIVDSRRKKWAQPVSRLLERDDDAEDTIEEILFVDPATPEDEALRRLFWQELFKVLDELPEAQRQVFIWNEIEGLTFREIAERTGENIKTLIPRKRYSVKQLRGRLDALRGDTIRE
jgi:RNA polymerase sigma factor (sigma-70 family)